MTKKVLTVGPHTHVCDAIQILVDHHLSGLPVVDEQKRFQGMITEEDLIHLMLEALITETKLVKDFMKINPPTCAPGSSVIEICEFFLKDPCVSLAVVEDNKLVGVISRSDILRLIPSKRQK